MRRARPAALIAACVLAACADRPPPRTPLDVSAASSLREPLLELERRYEQAHPEVDVRLNLAASGTLRRQVEQGAPVDVSVSAASEPVDQLIRARLLDGRSRRVVARNTLVIIVPATGTAEVHRIDDLARPEVRRVALGAPASVPAGAYARAALGAAGVADAIAGRTVFGQDVRQVLAYVASGNADAGIVYRTDAAVSDRVRIAAAVHPSLHPPIIYQVAVAAHASQPDLARGFVAVLLGPEGRAALHRHGYLTE